MDTAKLQEVIPIISVCLPCNYCLSKSQGDSMWSKVLHKVFIQFKKIIWMHTELWALKSSYLHFKYVCLT